MASAPPQKQFERERERDDRELEDSYLRDLAVFSLFSQWKHIALGSSEIRTLMIPRNWNANPIMILETYNFFVGVELWWFGSDPKSSDTNQDFHNHASNL